MGRLIVTEFVTLDGVGQAPGAPEEDRDGDFVHGGWQAPLLDEASGAVLFDQARTMDALLLGRHTYEIFAGYWPQAPAESPFTELLNRVPKYVASRTLVEPLTWSGSSVVPGDLAAGVAAIKERHDEVHVIGSLDLVQSLLREGLVGPPRPVGVPDRARYGQASLRRRRRPDRAAAGPHGDVRQRHRPPRVRHRRRPDLRRHDERRHVMA